VLKRNHTHNPKSEDQPDKLPSGKPTQNGLFLDAIANYKNGNNPELVKVYEKVIPGVWSQKGFFDLIDYKITNDRNRNVFRYILQLSDRDEDSKNNHADIKHTRVIPSAVKQEVWRRDYGKCVMCGDFQNLHFDHDLPFFYSFEASFRNKLTSIRSLRHFWNAQYPPKSIYNSSCTIFYKG